MSSEDDFSEATRFVIAYKRDLPPSELREALSKLLEASFFVFRAGQLYRLCDYRKGLGAERPASSSAPFKSEAGLAAQKARDHLTQLLEQPRHSDKKAAILFAIDALDFIVATQQTSEFEDYLHHFYGSPGYFIAYFETYQKAHTWLMNHPEPPDSGMVLIGDMAYQIVYFRENNHRILGREYTLERHIEILTERGLSPPQYEFTTRAEAEAWLAHYPDPPRAAFIMIAGEYHLAAYFKNINHRAIYPVSLVERWKERQKEIAAMKQEEDGEEGSDGT